MGEENKEERSPTYDQDIKDAQREAEKAERDARRERLGQDARDD